MDVLPTQVDTGSEAFRANREVHAAECSALDELLSEARKDATLKAARVTRSGGTLTSHGVIVWKPASTASGRRVYKLGKPYSQWAIQDFTLYSDKGPKLPVPPTATGRPRSSST